MDLLLPSCIAGNSESERTRTLSRWVASGKLKMGHFQQLWLNYQRVWADCQDQSAGFDPIFYPPNVCYILNFQKQGTPQWIQPGFATVRYFRGDSRNRLQMNNNNNDNSNNNNNGHEYVGIPSHIDLSQPWAHFQVASSKMQRCQVSLPDSL